jgi:hypothetical protein
MSTWLDVLLAIAAVGGVYVMLPLAVGAYQRARGRWLVTCPDSDEVADIELHARHAAVTSLVGEPEFRVRTCSRWPEHRGCAQDCLP